MAIVTKTRLSVMLKTQWRKKGAHTLEDTATIVGFNIWKIAQEAYKHMESEGFRFGSDAQVTTVVTEFIAFLLQSADRLVYRRLSEADRATFINAVGKHLANTMETNQRDLLGPGDYRAAFIDTLNAAFRDYAEFNYTNDGPSYPYLQCFAGKIADAMASSDNKWVVEQIIDIEAPDMLKFLNKLLSAVFTGPAGED